MKIAPHLLVRRHSQVDADEFERHHLRIAQLRCKPPSAQERACHGCVGKNDEFIEGQVPLLSPCGFQTDPRYAQQCTYSFPSIGNVGIQKIAHRIKT